MWASGNAFEVLGVRPALGRLLAEEDDDRGGADGAVAVISHRLWQTPFDGAADVIGRTLTLDRVPFRIVGVTARSFTGIDVGLPFDRAVPLSDMARMGRTDAILGNRQDASVNPGGGNSAPYPGFAKGGPSRQESLAFH